MAGNSETESTIRWPEPTTRPNGTEALQEQLKEERAKMAELEQTLEDCTNMNKTAAFRWSQPCLYPFKDPPTVQ